MYQDYIQTTISTKFDTCTYIVYVKPKNHDQKGILSPKDIQCPDAHATGNISMSPRRKMELFLMVNLQTAIKSSVLLALTKANN